MEDHEERENADTITPWSAILESVVHAIYETAFILLPVIVWAIVLISLGSQAKEVIRLPAISFAGLALYSAILRDGISAFHRDNLKDKRSREVLVVLSIIGVVVSTVFLTLSALDVRNHITELNSWFYDSVWAVTSVGVALTFVTKSILIQRKNHGRYA